MVCKSLLAGDQLAGEPVADKSAPMHGNGTELLALLDSPAFADAPAGDPEQMERDIAANRDDWGD